MTWKLYAVVSAGAFVATYLMSSPPNDRRALDHVCRALGRSPVRGWRGHRAAGGQVAASADGGQLPHARARSVSVPAKTRETAGRKSRADTACRDARSGSGAGASAAHVVRDCHRRGWWRATAFGGAQCTRRCADRASRGVGRGTLHGGLHQRRVGGTRSHGRRFSPYAALRAIDIRFAPAAPHGSPLRFVARRGPDSESASARQRSRCPSPGRHPAPTRTSRY